jgi:hypothetical protein
VAAKWQQNNASQGYNGDLSGTTASQSTPSVTGEGNDWKEKNVATLESVEIDDLSHFRQGSIPVSWFRDEKSCTTPPPVAVTPDDARDTSHYKFSQPVDLDDSFSESDVGGSDFKADEAALNQSNDGPVDVDDPEYHVKPGSPDRGEGKPIMKRNSWSAEPSTEPVMKKNSSDSAMNTLHSSAESDALDAIVAAVDIQQEMEVRKQRSCSNNSSRNSRKHRSVTPPPPIPSRSTSRDSRKSPSTRSESPFKHSSISRTGRESPSVLKNDTRPPLQRNSPNRIAQGREAPVPMQTSLLDAEDMMMHHPHRAKRLVSPSSVKGSPGRRKGDHLSDIPSDVDTTVKERYLLACRLLKSTLIEKESSLQPVEKFFLTGLIDEEQAEGAPSEAQVTAIQSAVETLLSDPLFSVGSLHSSAFRDGNEGIEVTKAKNKFLATYQLTRNKRSYRTPSPPVLSGRSSEETIQIQNRMSRSSEQSSDSERRQMLDRSKMHSLFSGSEDTECSFSILGLGSTGFKPTVLTPVVMEALRGFFPYVLAETNFWLKYSLERDGADLTKLMTSIRHCRNTILSVETTDGSVFGAFCSAPWRVHPTWFGSKDCFLWRLKHSRGRLGKRKSHDNEMEVYPYTGHDEFIQYCTEHTLAVGGGSDWSDTAEGNPYPGEPVGIGFMIDGDLMGGETNACTTFANPRLGERTSQKVEFDIRALEVWTLTPCNSEEEAKEMEIHNFFIEEVGGTES